MPCFKGLAVSIHTPDGPLPEYSVQRQSRLSRITSYIPVPPPKVPAGSSSDKPEQSTFAISITLLTPGQDVPYSSPKPTPSDPYPKPKVVGGLPGYAGERGRFSGAIGPYIPLTTSPNETIAAYIYFDGRAKEEVATLLRRGEETWVNSRWVGVPESEGGGLAEREFLFREVGLERWLNGLDLEGKDAAAKIERRRQKMEKRRRKRKEPRGSEDERDEDTAMDAKRGILRYGANAESPLEKVSDEDDFYSSDSDSDDDDPIPESAGQIKVALFRVLASGEIKRGEYSPQFDAHDDDEESQGGQNGHANGESGNGADIDHTTSFAKPKTLDPKSISTQTVTGIDPTDKPYAVFTFLYRGERQLQKMGILPTPKSDNKTPTSAKRRSMQTDFSSLGPLKPGGAIGFSTFRDRSDVPNSKSKKKASSSDMDSDEDDDEEPAVGKAEDVDVQDANKLLSPEEAEKTGELAEGVRKIKLKRQHSAERVDQTSDVRKTSKSGSGTPTAASTPPLPDVNERSTTPPATGTTAALDVTAEQIKDEESSMIGSPLKKQRASLSGLDDELTRRRLGGGTVGAISEVLGSSGSVQGSSATGSTNVFGGNIVKTEEEDEEL